jgi:hypothetical protein
VETLLVGSSDGVRLSGFLLARVISSLDPRPYGY